MQIVAVQTAVVSKTAESNTQQETAMMLLDEFHCFNWLNCFSDSRDSSVSVATKVLY